MKHLAFLTPEIGNRKTSTSVAVVTTLVALSGCSGNPGTVLDTARADAQAHMYLSEIQSRGSHKSKPDPDAYTLEYEYENNICYVYVQSEDKAISNITDAEGDRFYPTEEEEFYFLLGSFEDWQGQMIHVKSGNNGRKGRGRNNGTGDLNLMVPEDTPLPCLQNSPECPIDPVAPMQEVFRTGLYEETKDTEEYFVFIEGVSIQVTRDALGICNFNDSNCQLVDVDIDTNLSLSYPGLSQCSLWNRGTPVEVDSEAYALVKSADSGTEYWADGSFETEIIVSTPVDSDIFGLTPEQQLSCMNICDNAN